MDADGSVYVVPEEGGIDVVTVGDAGETGGDDLPYLLTPVDAEDVSAEELADIAGQVAEAVKNGDETLTGEAGTRIAEQVEANCKANPNMDDETAEAVENAASEASESAASGESGSQTGAAGPSNGSGSKPSSGSTAQTGNGGGSGSSTQTQQPTHTHNWVPVTTTVHHDAVYKTVHHDAVYQTVTTIICNSCGATFSTQAQAEAHMDETMLSGDMSHTWRSQTTNVKVKDAYDEQVLVSGAWDETVTTGYKCSTCGATK